jgi:replicative DNA helicase
MMRRAHRKHRLQLLVVDYLQRLDGEVRRRDSRTLEVGEITAGLKDAAKELGVPVLLLSQLNRDYDRDRERKPRLSDLRDSGSIEQDADIVILIHPTIPKDDEPPDRQSVELIVAKNRNGRRSSVHVIFNRPCMRFESAGTQL